MDFVHHAIVIARIASRYTQVATIRRRSLFACYIPGAALRFLRQMQQPINQGIIREELRRLEEEEMLLNRDVPSRYLSSMLASAYHFSLDEPVRYAEGNGLYWSFFKNQDIELLQSDIGFSIFDITDLDALKYCFLRKHAPLGSDIPSSLTIVDALEYVNEEEETPISRGELFLDQNPSPPSWHASVRHLLNYPLISGEAICEIWPKTFGNKDSNCTTSEENCAPSSGSSVPLLSDLLMPPAIRHAALTADFETLETACLLPGRDKISLDFLRASVDLDPFPGDAIPLLVQLLERTNKMDPERLDLSHFHLSTSQILSILRIFDAASSLNLSHNSCVSKGTIEAILLAHPQLRHLVLFNTNITTGEWSELLTHSPKLFYNLETILHPCFINASKPFWPNAFAIAPTSYSEFWQGSNASLPFFTPSLVVQALTIFLKQFIPMDNGPAGSALSTVVLSTTLLETGQEWEDRLVPFFVPRLWSGFDKTGWVFAFYTSRCTYGFLKLIPLPGPTHDGGSDFSVNVFDLHGFLDELEKDGRRPASAQAVERLADILKSLEKWDGQKFELFSQLEADEYVRKMDNDLDRAHLGGWFRVREDTDQKIG